MATDYTLNSTSTYTQPNTLNSTKDMAVNPKSILGKDDFMKLLLTELQYQDPTDPMDTEKILTQTSELATLESSDNTNKTLDKLATQLKESSSLGAISAIGKTGNLGKDTILLGDKGSPNFDLYFSHDIQSGTVKIIDNQNNTVKTLTLSPQKGGVLNFNWDGTDNGGNRAPSGSYKIVADYSDGSSNYTTSYGTYPIESVKFDNGKALLKMGNSYYSLDKVKEIY